MKKIKRFNVIWDFEDGFSAQEIARYWRYDLDEVLELLRSETGISHLHAEDALRSLEEEEAKGAMVRLAKAGTVDIPPEQAHWNIYDHIFGR